MPSITVKIEWDEPDRKEWLTAQQVEHCLSGIRSNNTFRVTDADPTGLEDISLNVNGKELPLSQLIEIASKRPYEGEI